MKNKLNKIISSLLIVAFLISMLSVFASASEGGAVGVNEETNEKAETSLIVKRDFDEGWDYDNGFSNSVKTNKFLVDYEEDSEYNYNYFFRAEIASVDNSFLQYAPIGADETREGSTVLEFSFKVDDYADIGNILLIRTSIDGKTLNYLNIENNELLALKLNNNSTPISLGKLDNGWVDVVFIFDWDNHQLTLGSTAPDVATDRTTTGTTADKLPEKYTFAKTVNLRDYGFRYEEVNKGDEIEISKDAGLDYYRLGIPGSGSRRNSDDLSLGMSYCVDNIKVYNSNLPVVSEFADNVYGRNVNTDRDKPINIQTGSGNKSETQILEEALCMKVGVDYALQRNQKITIFTNSETGNIYGAPIKVDGEVMISLELLLKYIDFPYYLHPDNLSFDITTGTSVTYLTVGRDTAKVDGDRVELTVAPGFIENENKDSYLAIALSDVETLFPGWLVTYDDMGLIIIYEDITPDNKEDNGDIINRDNNLETMLVIMKKFIFASELTDDKDQSYINMGTQLFDDAKENTDDFQHPYLLADQQTFDRLKTVLNAGKESDEYNETLQKQIEQMIKSAISYLNKYAEIDENGQYVKLQFKPVNPYLQSSEDPAFKDIETTSDGYDPDGGRLNITGTYTSFLPTIAFAYQMTGQDAYLEFAYNWMRELVTWEHWGPGHFLNAAEAAASFGIAYDWLYNGFVEKGYDLDVIMDGFVELTVHDGYVAAKGLPCEHPRNAGDNSHYAVSNSNWNAVCTAGMVIASLISFDYLSDNDARKNKLDEAIYLSGNNMINLPRYGLDEYAPDGSYIESASYWAYGTNAFFKLVMAVDSATGTDYGLMDTWGIDKTCYYACQITSSDGNIWNYHDGGHENGRMDTSTFNFVGMYLNDPALITLRKQHIERKYANVSLYDLIYYPFDQEISESVTPPLDYYMQGIDAFVSRDSWESGALYTGIMGGANNCNHGQIDSGNFIYYNKGIKWFIDLGSEEYNVYQYFGAERYKYYRAISEGQNVVLAIDDSNLMYGQHSTGNGKIIETYTNDHGSYAILNNKTAYSTTVSEALRGIYITNDKNTVVIQDQIVVAGKASSYNWVAHTKAEEIVLSSDMRTAYLVEKDEKDNEIILRASIVSPREDIFFELQNNVDEKHLLSDTHDVNFSQIKGGLPENSREGIKRLIIDCSNTSRFVMSVVFEIVDEVDSTDAVGYEYVDMTTWYFDRNLPSASDDNFNESATLRGDRIPGQIPSYNATVESCIKDTSKLFTTHLERFYKGVSDISYIISDKNTTVDNYPELKNYFTKNADHIRLYDSYREFMAEIISNSEELANKIAGID